MTRVWAVDWQQYTLYAVDDQVYVDDNKLYRCITQHTSTVSWDFIDDIANWKVIVFSWLYINQITTVSESTLLDTSYWVVLVDASGGDILITLPVPAENDWKVYHIKKIDSSVNVVNIISADSKTIDWETTQTISSQYTNITVVSDWNVERFII